MATCLIHPEVRTDRRCALCAQPHCGACLEPLEPVGPVCTPCATLLESLPPDALPQRLEALRAEVQASLPPEKPWWGWNFFFWSTAAIPTFLAIFYLYQMFQFQQLLAIVSEEPRLPGQVTARLTEVATGLEEYRLQHGQYPASLDQLDKPFVAGPVVLRDAYSWRRERFLYVTKDGRYQLCSRGPDRVFNGGAPLDRFTAQGDMCVGSS